MTKHVRFWLNEKEVEARLDETIWQVSARLGHEIPHLCYRPAVDYRGDGNCRACMVEIDGEKALSPSCIRKPTPGMIVNSLSKRAKKARRMVMELLLADNPQPEGEFKRWLSKIKLSRCRLPRKSPVKTDESHPAIAVDLNKCIHCQLCIQACREIQGNDVIGMEARGSKSSIVFDMSDPMGDSTCVACGECVEACPTGALASKNIHYDNHANSEKTVESVCPYCGVGCQINVHVKNNSIAYVEGKNGPANHSRLCVKGRYGLDYTNHHHRLTSPLIRLEGAKKKPELFDNPMNNFRESTWEEALDTVANGFLSILNSSSPNSLAGFGSAKVSNEEAYLFQKLIRTGFQTNNVDHCTRLCHASSVAALQESIGSSAVTAPVINCLDSDVIFVIGANPSANHPVAASFIKNAVRKGSQLIVADPRKNSLKNYTQHYLQFTPGSDVALLNAMINVIIVEELFNTEYVKNHTEGFENLAKHIASFTPEKMAPICNLDASEIKSVARKFAQANAAMIFWGMGIAQHTHGTDNARCLIALALICGHIGRPGAGLHPLRGQNNVQGASDAGLIPMMYPDYRPVEDKNAKEYFEQFWTATLSPKRGLTVVETINAIKANTVHGMYVMGENPAMSDPDTHHTIEALSELRHLVVQDIFMTETASLADVVLPASTWLEKDGTATNTDRRVQIGRQALKLPGNAREDWWIIQEIGQRMGLDWNYSGPEQIHKEMQQCMTSMKNISWERLGVEHSVTYPCDSKKAPGHDIIFRNKFPTPSGRGMLIPSTILPSDEIPDDEFPLILTTGRLLEHWHTGSMTRRSSTLNSIEPEATVHICQTDMEKFGVTPGEHVKISTRRGSIELAVRQESSLQEGLIFIPFCYVEAPANMLTNPALDPTAKIPELKFSAARLEKN